MKVREIIRESKVEASKPRNFVAKNAKMGGAGQHKDKKKAEKQGDVKHKNKQFAESQVSELSKGTLSNYSDKADMDIVKKHRVRGPQSQAGDKAAVAKTDKKIDKRMAGIDSANKRLNKEVAEDLAEDPNSVPQEWREWNVMIMNNFYSGKYPDYSARYYSVVAGSTEEAREVVLSNTEKVLRDLLARKTQDGKRVLPPKSALPIEDKRVGGADRIKPGSVTTMGFKEMLTPDGPMMLKFASGKIVDVQGKQGVAEGSVKELSMDLKTLSDAEFQAQYKMTKAQARAGLQGKAAVKETATAGSTSAGNVAVGAVYKNKKAKMQKPGTNALDMKGTNLLTGGSIKR